MKTTKFLNQKNPSIFIDTGDVTFIVEKRSVEIKYYWDNGYGGRWSNFIRLNREELISILTEIDQ